MEQEPYPSNQNNGAEDDASNARHGEDALVDALAISHMAASSDVGALLTAVVPHIDERFRRELEERLVSKLLVVQAMQLHAVQEAEQTQSDGQPDVQVVPEAVVTGQSSGRAALPVPMVPTPPRSSMLGGFRRNLGRAASLAMGGVGVVLLALLFVGMSALLGSRQPRGVDPNQPWVTPTSASASEPSNEAFAASLQPITSTQEQLAESDSIAWSPDGRTAMLAVLGPRALRLWNLATNGGPGSAVDWAIPGGAHTGIAWSPDGKLLATRSNEGTAGHITLWDATNLSQVESRPLPKSAVAMAWSPDGQTLAYSDGDVFTLWKVGGDVPSSQFVPAALTTVPSDGAKITAMTWSWSGRLAVSRGSTVTIWDPNDADHNVATLHNNGQVTWLAWANGGGVLAASVAEQPGSKGGTSVALWGAVNDYKLNEWMQMAGVLAPDIRADLVTSVAWSPARSILAVGIADLEGGEPRNGRVELYDLDLAAKKPLRTLPGMATGLAWSPDGKQLAVADSRERNLTLWGMPGEATAAGTAVATPTLPGSGAPDVTPTPAIPTDPTQAAIASMTVIPPPTAIPGLQATHVARATAFPFPTSDPSTVQADAYTSAVAITRRGGVELELRLAGDTYLAGETGRAEVVVRNTTAQRVFAGNLQFSVQDEEGRAVDLWPMMPQMRAGWPGQNRPGGALGMLPPVEPGATITSTFPFTLPPIEQSGQHRYTARASAQISRADIQHSDRGDGVPVEVQTEDIPLRITEPGPQQHLKAELQNNHPRYTLRVTSADGRPVTGPLWGAIEVSGRMAGPLHDSPDGAWTFDWSGYFTQEGIHLQVRAWVAARGYLPAVITQTLSGPASSPDSLRTLARWQTPLVATDSVAWSADGLRVAAASDSRVALYDAASGTSLGDFTVDGPGRVEGISWSRDGRFIAVRTFDGTGARGPQAPKGIIWVVDAETLRGLYSLEMPERILKTSWVWLPYAPILAATDGFRISYWDEFLMRAPGASSASSLQPTGLPTVSAGDPGVGPNMVSNLAWSPNTGRLTLATSQYKRVRLWDVVQGKEFASFDNPGGVIKMEWQPGKELLAVLAVDENDTPNNVVLVWDVTTGTPRELWTIKPGKQISSIAWSSKNILAVSTHGESRGLEQGRDSIALYDGATGTLLREVEGFATDLAWSADGQTLAIANARDGVVTLLGTGVRGTPQPIPTVPPTPDSVPTPNS